MSERLIEADGLRQARMPLWKILLAISEARCNGGPDEAAEQDAASALGMDADKLRAEIEKRTNKPMATALRKERVYLCSDPWAEMCPAREQRDCPRKQGHKPPSGQGRLRYEL